MFIIESDVYFSYISLPSNIRTCLNEMIEHNHEPLEGLSWVRRGGFYRLIMSKGEIASSHHADLNVIATLKQEEFLDSLGMATNKTLQLKEVMNEVFNRELSD